MQFFPASSKEQDEAVALLHHDESGQDLIEYVLIAALLGIGAVGIMGNLAAAVATGLQAFSGSIPNL